MNSLEIVLTFLLFAAFISVPIVVYIRQRHVERTGLVVLGTVVGFKPRSNERGEMMMEITLDYPLDDGTPWNGIALSFRQPKKGSHIAIVVDRKDPSRIYIANERVRKRAGENLPRLPSRRTPSN